MSEPPIPVNPATLRQYLDSFRRAKDTAGFVLDELPLFVAKYAISPRIADCWRQDYQAEIVTYDRHIRQLERLLRVTKCDNTR